MYIPPFPPSLSLKTMFDATSSSILFSLCFTRGKILTCSLLSRLEICQGSKIWHDFESPCWFFLICAFDSDCLFMI